MTQKARIALSAAGVAALAFAAFLSASSGAGASTLRDCRADSKSKVVDCCKQMTMIRKPLWMLQSATSCDAAAQCSVRMVPGASITHVSKPKRIVVCGIVKRKPPHDDNPNDPPRNPPAVKEGPNNPPGITHL